MSRHTCARRNAEPTLHLLARLAARPPAPGPAPRGPAPARWWRGSFESSGRFVAFPLFRGDLTDQPADDAAIREQPWTTSQ